MGLRAAIQLTYRQSISSAKKKAGLTYMESKSKKARSRLSAVKVLLQNPLQT